MNQTKHIGYSIALGIGLGLISAIIVILLLLMNAFSWMNPGFFLIALIMVSLPLCFNFLAKYGFRILPMQMTMIVVSFLITVVYAVTVQNASSYAGNLIVNVLKESGFLHALSAAVLLVVSFLGRGGKR